MTENRTLGDFGGDDDEDDDNSQHETTGVAVESDADSERAEAPESQSAEASETKSVEELEAQVTDDTSPEPTTESATVTYAWSPAGDACDACGETADRRWRAGEGADDPDALVCPDCKEW